jgi:methionyl-tRNA formyltransferase
LAPAPSFNLRLVFMGTPDFAATILGALLGAGHEILCVYTQPPRPAGRGHKISPSPVQKLAVSRSLRVETPQRFDAEAVEILTALKPDVAVIAAYGLILPKIALGIPRFGCLNVHASLLPRWRGAAPIERALVAGDRETGISIMRMEEDLDTGPVLLAERFPIRPGMSAAALYEELAALGSRLILAALAALAQGKLSPKPQPEEGATYAAKLQRDEGALDWRKPAAELERAVRAFRVFPGTYFTWNGNRIRVLAAELADNPADAGPGTVLDGRLTIACGEGALRLAKLQRPGRAALDAAEFLRGFAIPQGAVLPCPASS